MALPAQPRMLRSRGRPPDIMGDWSPLKDEQYIISLLVPVGPRPARLPQPGSAA